VIGTAGHVDHGKTSLVHALTGVMTDRLPEEQRRGITIELGFAPWQVSDELLVSIIDAPGHRRLVHNMIAGASGIDLVLLIVAGDEGVMPQTREHVAACRLLGVARAIVAVTKLDRVDRELAELAGEEARELCEANGIAAEVVLCSARSGEGTDELRRAVVEAVRAGRTRRERRRARLAVDRVFTVHGAGTVVTGTLVDGALAVGGSVRVLGAARELGGTVRGLHVHGRACDRAEAPTRLAVNLGGVEREAVVRGAVLTDDAAVCETRVLDVWLEPIEPLARGSDATLHLGTARSTARIQPLGERDLLEGGLARLRLVEPLVAAGGDRFVLRGANVDGPAGAVIGGGTVLDARPPRTIRAQKREALLAALHEADATAAARALAEECAPASLLRRELASRFAIDATALGDAASRLARSELVAIGEGVWTTRSALEQLKAEGLELVAAHHEAHPLQAGMELQTLRAELARRGDERTAGAAIGELTSGGRAKLLAQGPVVRLATFDGARSNAAAAATLAKVTELVTAAGLDGLTEGELETAGLDAKLARGSLASLERTGAVVHAGRLWFDAAGVARVIALVKEHFLTYEVLTIAEVKERLGLSRKQAIPLLEHLDRQRVTLRAENGSDRRRGPNG